MKKSLTSFTAIFAIFLFTNARAQVSAASANLDAHHGFQFSFFIGAGGGSINGTTKDIGTMSFKGPSANCNFHVGYAIHNWGFGFTYGSSSLLINSIDINGKSYVPQTVMSMDHMLTGVYVTKYFMPYNVYVSAEGGVGTFGLSDATGNAISSKTDRGFSWNLRAGKEFSLGKKKTSAIGVYVNLNGLACQDGATFPKDKYSYLGPGGGINYSFH